MIFWKIIYNIFLLPALLIFGVVGSLFHKKIRDGMIGRFLSYGELKSFMERTGQGSIGSMQPLMVNLNK